MLVEEGAEQGVEPVGDLEVAGVPGAGQHLQGRALDRLVHGLGDVHRRSDVVVATHDPNFVERVDRCIALRDGHVIHDGPATPADVIALVGT